MLELKRGGKRQVAPFSKGTQAPELKRPDRKPASVPFRFRAAPPPEVPTEEPVDVEVPCDGCLMCGGDLVMVYQMRPPPSP
jgi:hypothetical protein